MSFANDVQPLLATRCAQASCHGSTTTSPAGIYLGSRAAVVYANLVGVFSTELPTMVRVAPGDPAGSFLFRRLDGDACTLPGCTAVACSELMPQGGPPLEQASLLLIRDWISQGALDDLPDAGPADDGGIDGGTIDAGGGAIDAARTDGGDASSDAASD